MVEAEGAVVAANFGSVVGEMAVLWHAVGIADRSELAKLELRGAPEFVSQSVEYLSGTPVQARSVMRTKGTSWLPIAPDRMMILCEPRRRDELADSLEEITQPTERSSWVDVTGNYAVIALVGPNAEALLQAAGADDDVQVPGEGCLRDTRLAGRAALLVRETPWNPAGGPARRGRGHLARARRHRRGLRHRQRRARGHRALGDRHGHDRPPGPLPDRPLSWPSASSASASSTGR